jgi:2-oxoglutarate dehydrogenase E2 component (dihydrolipoamide succinyltransferase)
MGESITGGLLANWLVQDGQAVKKGQALFSFETDKITSEANAEADGAIRIKVAAGTEVTVGQVVATIDAGAAGTAPTAAIPAPAKVAATPAPAAAPKSAPAPVALFKSGAAAEISPAVRRIAAETGLNPATVSGTGKAGRVTKGDMLGVLSGETPTHAAPSVSVTPSAASAPAAKAIEALAKAPEGRVTRKKMSPLRRKIAERLVLAKSETAMLTTFNEVNMAPVMEFRKRYGEEFLKKHGVKLGLMSFFAKASCLALKDIPAVNAQIQGDEIVYFDYVDLSVAVSAPDDRPIDK